MAKRQPTGPPPPPVVQRVRVRYAKRGRLRFASHRDFARSLERAVRRAGVPIAFSAGFSPHPRISYVGAAPTGAASEAEYLELALSEPVDVDALRVALDAALPEGFDVLETVEAGPGSLAERMVASRWRVELAQADELAVRTAVAAFLAADAVIIERPTKDGTRPVDARAAVVHLGVQMASEQLTATSRAILDLVVRQVTPSVRPDDVLAALRALTGFVAPLPPRATRMAQGPMTGESPAVIGDPLAIDRTTRPAGAPTG